MLGSPNAARYALLPTNSNPQASRTAPSLPLRLICTGIFNDFLTTLTSLGFRRRLNLGNDDGVRATFDIDLARNRNSLSGKIHQLVVLAFGGHFIGNRPVNHARI